MRRCERLALVERVHRPDCARETRERKQQAGGAGEVGDDGVLDHGWVPRPPKRGGDRGDRDDRKRRGDGRREPVEPDQPLARLHRRRPGNEPERADDADRGEQRIHRCDPVDERNAGPPHARRGHQRRTDVTGGRRRADPAGMASRPRGDRRRRADDAADECEPEPRAKRRARPRCAHGGGGGRRGGRAPAAGEHKKDGERQQRKDERHEPVALAVQLHVEVAVDGIAEDVGADAQPRWQRDPKTSRDEDRRHHRARGGGAGADRPSLSRSARGGATRHRAPSRGSSHGRDTQLNITKGRRPM